MREKYERAVNYEEKTIVEVKEKNLAKEDALIANKVNDIEKKNQLKNMRRQITLSVKPH